MKLSDYPQKIAEVQCALLAQEGVVRRLKDVLQACDREIECAIAFDADLKNDSQRKAKRAELQADEEYQGALLDLQYAQDGLARLQIDVEMIRNQFSAAKLEVRLRLAQLEAAVA